MGSMSSGSIQHWLVAIRFKAHTVSEHLRTSVEAKSDMVNETC